MYDVIIVGAGPAGLFSAYELCKNNSKLKILILDKGKYAKNRLCPIAKNNGVCINCTPCQILSGYGGAGTFSDGKLNFIPKLGKSDLFKYMTPSEAYKLIDDTEEIFNQFEMDAKVYPTNMEEAQKLEKEIAKNGAKLLIIKNKHIGSDHLPNCIDKLTNYLKEHHVETKELCNVHDIKTINPDNHEVICSIKGKPITYQAKKVIIAPGRTGAKWVGELANKYNIPYISQSIEIGVRIEFRKEIMEDISKILYEPTIFIKTKTYGDEIRTFCSNPGGYVAKESYEGYCCVNGYSLKDTKSNNSNFAFISKVNLTEPVTDTRMYGESIARIANVLGAGKPIIQTLKDLRDGRRSNWHRINKGFVEPTLKDCVAGDLALVLPHRIIINILEGLEILDKIMPGINNGETLLYGPEIKFFSNEITTNNKFKLENDNIYFIGDGAGKAGNIVAAAATGLVAARDILEKN